MTLRKQIGFLITFVTLSACAGTVTDVNRLETSNSAELAVIASNPYVNFNASQRNIPTNVALDQPIEILFNQRIDAYSTLLPNNFELWTEDGSRIDGSHELSATLVPNPLDKTQLVSLVRFRPEGGYLPPNQELTFAWRDAYSAKPSANEAANTVGIYSIDGRPLRGGGFSFRTGTKATTFGKEFLEVQSITPGTLISKRSDLTDDYRSTFNTAVTVNSTAPIRIRFSEPIKDLFNINDDIRKEITRTDISNFPALTVGIIDDVTESVSSIFSSIGNVNLKDWSAFREESFRRLRGTVHTEDGRRTLVFQLYKNTSYPNSMSQAVIVVITGLAGSTDIQRRRLKDDYIVGGFIHFTGFELPVGFPSIQQGIQGLFNWGDK